MAGHEDKDLQVIVRSAVADEGIDSAAIFVPGPGSPDLHLAAAAGIEGPALDRLVAAVQDPGHPIALAMTDDGPTFDVRPTAPGGPALRSHVPMVATGHGASSVVGVLAVAHDYVLTESQRGLLIRLAASAAAAVAPDETAGPIASSTSPT